MGGIFISYRREDSQGEALHLFDDLKESFGADHVFMDVTGIDPGKDFRKVIDGAVGGCDVFIAVIGKKWLDEVDEAGKRRLDDPKDFVRIETAAALSRDVAVIPVLVQGVGMPRSDQLPPEIEALAWRNAFELRHNRWNVDVEELVKALVKVVPIENVSALSASAASSIRSSRQLGEGQKTSSRQFLSKSSLKRHWGFFAVFALVAGIAILLLVYLHSPERQAFPEPMYGGFRLDTCYEFGTRCGEEPATEWCKKKGFERAVDYQTETVGDRGIITKLIGTQATCREAFCTAFKYIACER
jgi:TIR domain